MGAKTEVQKASEETMRFMRGHYVLDEVPGKYYDIDCLKFCQGKKTILSINIHEDHYDFQVIFGKAEREKFEARRNEFPNAIQDLYDSAHTYHDGKWMLLRVEDMAALEIVKQLILIKKKPNRKPFPSERAIYADCGYRCDLCVHHTGGTISDELRAELKERITRIYDPDNKSGYWGDDMALCGGCAVEGCMASSPDTPCEKRKCMASNGVDKCKDCALYPCYDETVHGFAQIHSISISADDVTKAILPYVPGQYGN